MKKCFPLFMLNISAYFYVISSWNCGEIARDIICVGSGRIFDTSKVIAFPSPSWFSMWSLSSTKPRQNPLCISYFLFNLSASAQFLCITTRKYDQTCINHQEVTRRHSPWRLVFNPSSFCVGFMLGNVALKQVFSRIILFFLNTIVSRRPFIISETDSLS